MDPNLKTQSASREGTDDDDDESGYLYNVMVEQIDQNEEEIMEALRSEIKVLVDDERAEAKKMLATFGADDDDTEKDGDADGVDGQTETPKQRKATPSQASGKKAAKSKAKAKGKALGDKTSGGVLMDLTAKNLSADVVSMA